MLHQTQRTEKEKATGVQTHFAKQGLNILLATALVKAKTINGQYEYLRALVDPGSQASFISESAAQVLALPRTKVHAAISGMGTSEAGIARNQIEIEIQPRFPSSFRLRVQALVLSKLTKPLPNNCITSINEDSWLNEMLADPTYQTPGPIDVIIGADFYCKIILEGVRKTNSGILAQNTELGWILSGRTTQAHSNHVKITSLVSHVDIENQLKMFWEIEEISSDTPTSEDDSVCEQHYSNTHVRGKDGRYTTRIPFKSDPSTLGDSRRQAIARLLQNERKFTVNKKLKDEYNKFMNEYIALGHMKLVNRLNTNGCYLPHQAIIKDDSSTTKLRVVFDASTKTSNGHSLNDCMYAGPRLQNELTSILLRWRKYRYVLTADIEKMYRQIQIHTDDQQFQKVLWRSSPDEPIKDYYLTTVTYGTASAPFLAIRTLKQLASDEKKSFPRAAEIVLKDFYVDDLMTGTDTLYEAKLIQQNLIKLLSLGGFNLRKWTSNRQELLQTIPEDFREKRVLDLCETEAIKTLGIHWHPANDNFEFRVNLSQSDKPSTKRTVLSEISKIFDPLGWLSPVIISAKILMQEIWAGELSWDQALPPEIEKKWIKIREEFTQLENIRIPRWIKYKPSNQNFELHGFCDASEKAYAAVIYSRVLTEQGEIVVTLLTAKTKVAPIRNKLTIPRLELCAASLLTELIGKTAESLDIKKASIHAWSDSRITLAWIKGEPNQWKSFVGHRVAKIQANIKSDNWRYVKSEENPADCASRGIYPSQIKHHSLWWTGPHWLRLPQTEWPIINMGNCQTTEEQRKLKCVVYSTTSNTEILTSTSILEKYSSMTKLIRIIAYCNRFIETYRKRKLSASTPSTITIPSSDNIQPLTMVELKKALQRIIRMVQSVTFADEIKCLMARKPLASKSQLLSLSPYLDEDHILRVGGRLQHSLLPFNSKHPIILPHRHHFTDLVINNAHETTLHGGSEATLAYIRRRFWIINAKSTTRRTLQSCVKCCRYKGITCQQAMGNLPAPRVTPSRPFLHTGVDYAGPFQVKISRVRNTKVYKGYIAVFVCLATKAIHIEVVSDLTTEAFLAALARTTARRGPIANLYSDCGTTFRGASNELQQQFHSIVQQITKDASTKLASNGIQWHFIPPGAPHFGGIWEAGVKSIKYHLKRVLGDTILTYEEFSTILCRIEACLNSRPLCPLSNDPNDLSVLTPGHFLVGDTLIAHPEPCNEEQSMAYLTRWRMIQKLHNDFWKAWSNDYLSQLQQKSKWYTHKENIKKGDIVLLKSENTPPSRWPLARIMETHPGTDGLVRVVTLKTATSTFKRPIVKICKLPLQESSASNQPPGDQEKTFVSTVDKQAEALVSTVDTYHPGKNNKAHHNTTSHSNKRGHELISGYGPPKNKKGKIRIHPVSGYSCLIPPDEQKRRTEEYRNKRKLAAIARESLSPRKRLKSNGGSFFHSTLFLCWMLLILTKLAKGAYNITYPAPGIYIEHMGEAKIRRGTLKVELNLPSNITADAMRINGTILQMQNICSKTKEFSEEIHCELLVQHLRHKQDTFLGEIEVLKSKTQNRTKRNIVGRLLESVFGVNDEVYADINTLKDNQELLRQATHHQASLMLSTIATVNHTEAKITQKLNMLTSKLNNALAEVNRAQGWFTKIDANKANIHILAAYQLAVELIDGIEEHYIKLIESILGRGSLLDFTSPRQLMDIIQSASRKIPPNLQISQEPEKRVEISTNDTAISISGFFHIIGFQVYSIDKYTPIPQRLGNGSYIGLDTSTSIMATNYDTQTYFDIREAEFEKCIQQEMIFFCSPTVVRNMESNPNCIIDEVYHRPEKQQCPLKVFSTPDIVWKQLYMKNTWLFIANLPTTAAIKCNGIREDALLNGTGIIQVGQECLIQTKKNILISEVFNAIPVKFTLSKALDFNVSTTILNHKTEHRHLELEPILKNADDFTDVFLREKILQQELNNTTWKTIGHHTITGASSITITIMLFILYKILRQSQIVQRLRKAKQKSTPHPIPRASANVKKDNAQSTRFNLRYLLERKSTLEHNGPAKASTERPAECSWHEHTYATPDLQAPRNIIN